MEMYVAVKDAAGRDKVTAPFPFPSGVWKFIVTLKEFPSVVLLVLILSTVSEGSNTDRTDTEYRFRVV